MYESPIDIIYSEMQTKLEGKVFKAVQNVGINVNKDELIKALSYDRHQYEKGYADAKAEQQWIPASSGNLPEEYEPVLISTIEEDCDHVECGMIRDKKEWITIDGLPVKVVAWMPLPMPFREGGADDGT